LYVKGWHIFQYETLAHRLGIIQDSESDWLNESATMGEVYSKGFLNLAATASVDSHGGLFRSLEFSHNRELIAVKVGGKHLAHMGKDLYCISDEPWGDRFQNTPLHKRAWTYQESVLAPMTLYLSKASYTGNAATFVLLKTALVAIFS
jgi:Heterokaryon incompatibility protein (HET)